MGKTGRSRWNRALAALAGARGSVDRGGYTSRFGRPRPRGRTRAPRLGARRADGDVQRRRGDVGHRLRTPGTPRLRGLGDSGDRRRSSTRGRPGGRTTPTFAMPRASSRAPCACVGGTRGCACDGSELELSCNAFPAGIRPPVAPRRRLRWRNGAPRRRARAPRLRAFEPGGARRRRGVRSAFAPSAYRPATRRRARERRRRNRA
jgi:hypothetical protein